MFTFDRYIIRNIVLTTAIALLFLTGMDFLIQSAAEADDIGGDYTFAVVALTLLLQLPDKILLFMPAAVLIGGIIGLGQLNSQNELIIPIVGGASRLRTVSAAIFTAFVLGLVALIIGETVAPDWQAQSRLLRAQAKGQSAEYQSGLWLRDQNRLVHIGAIHADGSIENIRFFANEADGIHISHAQSARYQAPDWQLDGQRTFTINKDRIIRSESEPRWQNGAAPAMLQALATAKQAETIRELYTLTRFLHNNGLSHSQESLKLWQRLLLPLSSTTMLLLALPFVFGRTRSRHQGARLVLGILCGVAYYIAQGILANLSLLYGWQPLLGALLPIIAFSAFPLILLRRQS